MKKALKQNCLRAFYVGAPSGALSPGSKSVLRTCLIRRIRTRRFTELNF